MSNLFRFSFVFLVLIIKGLVSDAQVKADIKNSKSSKHTHIPGTRAFLIVPAGFSISPSSTMIEKAGQGRIQVMDLVGGNFYTNAATFSKERFEKSGVKVYEYDEFKINNYPAKMVFMQGDDQTKAYNLVFGDTTFSTSIIGLFSSDDTATGHQIKQAIQSIYYDKSYTVDPFAAAPFRIDDSKSMFKFSQLAATMYLFSIGGVKKDSYGNDPYAMILATPGAGVELDAMATEMASILKNPQEKNVSETKTNGFQSYKREVYGDLNGKQTLLFQHLVVIGQSVVMMQGIATGDFEKNVIEFEKLFGTINRK